MWLYRLTNKTNGKRYIGTSVNPVAHRVSRHLYCANRGRKDMAIACAIRKHGLESFSVEIIGESNDYGELLEMEANAIQAECTRTPNGYNISAGGLGARRPCSQETKSRISAKMKGRTPWNYGKRNARTIARYARTRHVGGPKPGSKPWNLGVEMGPMPEEHRKKIAEAIRRVRAARFWSTKKESSTSGGI